MGRLSLSVGALFLGGACAQDWGTTGSWELVAATGSGPQRARWHSAATTGGAIYITGGSDTSSNNATFQFDTSTNSWTQLPDLPSGFLSPSVVTFGGMLMMFGK